MKKAALIIFILGFILSGSFAQQNKDAVYGDDVYFTASKNKKKDNNKKQSETITESSDSVQQVVDPDSSSSVSPKSSTLYDDYNDYAYSARIKRFHNPEEDVTYFNDTYTDPANYDSNYQEGTSSPDVNVYVDAGYGSCYGPSMSFGFGWGYDPWYWSSGWGWGYPYYNSWYWGYNSWWYNPYSYYWSPYSYGYWNGYYAGYYDGYYGNPYGWNNWDYQYGSNTYYGRRMTVTSSGGNNLNTRNTEVKPNTPTGQDGRSVTQTKNERAPETRPMNERTVVNNDVTSKKTNPVPAVERTTSTKVNPPATQQRYQYTPTQKENQPSSTKTTSQYTRQQQQPSPKYIKPEQSRSTQTTTRTQSYTSPTYRQPKSSQEYLSPRTQPSRTSMQQQTRSGQPTTTRPPATQTQRQNVVPSTINRQSPGSTGNQIKTNNSPTRNYTPSRTTPTTRSNSYSTPSRSNSSPTPSRSNNYSSPSRSSSPSYSAPSRSSGSSGSGGFGGRRK